MNSEQSRGTYTQAHADELRAAARAERPRYEVQLAKLPGGWTARCYHEDGEHVWSSEGAATVRLALSEIARAVEEDPRK